MFDKDKCIISDKQMKKQVISIQRTRNNMFPLDVCSIGSLNMAVKSQTSTELWHFRLGHLNYRSLLSMAQKKLVVGLLEVKQAS